MGGSPGWWRSEYHNWDEETAGAESAKYNAAIHRQRTGNALNSIYRELDYEQTRIQNKAFESEIRAFMNKHEIEWKIYEQEVKKGQANYVSNLYTQRIISELGNLLDVLKAK
jgi:hypothetical protein